MTLIVIMFLLSGCSTSQGGDIGFDFYLEKKINISNKNIERNDLSYSTHGLQNNKLLFSSNFDEEGSLTTLMTKELFLVDVDTEEVEILRTFDEKTRVWDYVLSRDGFIYSTIEEGYSDPSGVDLLKFSVIESISGHENIIASGYIAETFKTPSFHYINDKIYFLIEEFIIENGTTIGQKILLYQYYNKTISSMIEIENKVENYYLLENSERLLSTELSKGYNSLGFVTHKLDEFNSKVYTMNSKETIDVDVLNKQVTNIMLLGERGLFQTINLADNNEIIDIHYFDIKSGEKMITIPEEEDGGRIVAFSEDVLGYIDMGGYVNLLSTDKGDVDYKITKVYFPEYKPDNTSFVYGLNASKFVIVQFPKGNFASISVVKYSKK